MLTDRDSPERVTKIDVARRQLVTAIRLFFEDRDAISVHTLTAAAHEILRDLSKLTDGASIIKDNPLVRPERRKEFVDIVNRPQNFFKHADRDPDGQMEFRSEVTQFLLIDAIFMYEALTRQRLPKGAVFATWFMTKYPNVINKDNAELVEVVNELHSKVGGELKRSDFLMLLNSIDH